MDASTIPLTSRFKKEKQNASYGSKKKKQYVFHKKDKRYPIKSIWVLAVEAFQLMLKVQVIKKCYVGYRRIIFFMKFFLGKNTFIIIK